ncbi:MAG: hypothetical protein LBQ58_08560 [Synergistaceae bacterium]|jgi:antitoxin component of RelBE/YafQ-DinJ toxin-antitoxin module|nr:hypothetical protein [Synergistaceae bacterium]
MPEKIFSTRVDDELQREFRSIIVRKGQTVSAVVGRLMEWYVEKEGGTVPGKREVIIDPLDKGAPNAETIDIPAIKQEIAALEAKYGTAPNAETIAAMKEARAGHGEPMTLEELRAECNALH